MENYIKIGIVMNFNLAKANKFYRQKDYTNALKAYRSILEKDVNNVSLLFNLYLSNKKISYQEQEIAFLLSVYAQTRNPYYKKIIEKNYLLNADDYLSKIDGKVSSKEELKDYVVESLWGGYSLYSAVWLELIVINTKLSEEVRFTAAWQAARWYHFNDEYEKALDKIQQIKSTFSFELSSRKIILMLEVFSYIGLNKEIKARKLLDNYVSQKPLDSDCLFALASLEKTASGKLSKINEVYTHHELTPIKQIDINKELTLYNIYSTAVKVRSDSKVSVIIPAFNAEKLISTALDSLLNQSWVNIEVIVVDDCSTDNTFNIVKEYENKDQRVKAILQQTNSGAYAARNKGLEYASGDYITTHDADDWSHPQKIQMQVEFLEKNPNVKGVCTYWIRTLPNLTFTQNWRVNSELIHWSHSSFLFRKDVINQIGVWDQVTVGGDTEFIWRIQAKFGKWAVKNINKNVPMAFALDDESSLTRTKSTHVKTIHYGLRHIYRAMAQLWHAANKAKDLHFNNHKRPFKVPLNMQKRVDNSCTVNELYVGDFSDFYFFSKIENIIKNKPANITLGLLHYPTFSAKRVSINSGFLNILFDDKVKLVAPGQTVYYNNMHKISSDELHFKYKLDTFPECIKCDIEIE